MKTRGTTFRLMAIAFILVAGTTPAQTKKAGGIEFVKIKPGEFMMGCSTGDDACNDDEKPHIVFASPSLSKSESTR
jgi:formylglycine-generating enzyme required for sulfatase activity